MQAIKIMSEDQWYCAILAIFLIVIVAIGAIKEYRDCKQPDEHDKSK